MKAFAYILYSLSLSRFYYGSTELAPKERLAFHLKQYYGNRKYTAKVDDWEIYIAIECSNITQARRIEKYIKKMKSKQFTESLKDDPNRIKWLQHNI